MTGSRPPDSDTPRNRSGNRPRFPRNPRGTATEPVRNRSRNRSGSRFRTLGNRFGNRSLKEVLS